MRAVNIHEAKTHLSRLIERVLRGGEIAIKAKLGRVTLPEDAERYVPEQVELNAFQVLPIRLQHALRVASLPDVHRDPFDRLLVAQALIENLTVLSKDRRLSGYPV